MAIPKLPSKLIQARIIKRSVHETRLDKSISSIFLLSLPIAHLSHEDVIDSQVYVCSDVSDEDIIIIIMRRINVKDLHLQLCYDKVSYFACRRFFSFVKTWSRNVSENVGILCEIVKSLCYLYQFNGTSIHPTYSYHPN